MIKGRLVRLLSHAKKYIVYQVLWQWLSLLCQVLMVYCLAVLVEKAFLGELVKNTVLILWNFRLRGNGASFFLRPSGLLCFL